MSDRLPAAALETTLCVFRCSVGVCVDALLACDIVWYGCELCPVCPVAPLCFLTIGWAKCRNNPFGVRILVFLHNACTCVLGAVPMVGRRSRLSVPWSLKTTPRKEGRPMGPATPRVFDSSGWVGVFGGGWEMRLCFGCLSGNSGESNLCLALSPFRT